MRWSDLFGIALSALGQQKVRTALSVLGVAIGTFALALSVSVGQGVEGAVVRLFRRFDQLRRIQVSPGWETKESEVPAADLKVDGRLSLARRERIRRSLVRRWSRTRDMGPRPFLTEERIKAIAALEHVQAIIPSVDVSVHARLGEKELDAQFCSAPLDDSHIRARLMAGQGLPPEGGRKALVHEFLLYQWGIVTEDEIQSVLGKRIRLDYRLDRPFATPMLTVLSAGRIGVESKENKAFGQLLRRLPKLLETSELTPDERGAANVMIEGLSRGSDSKEGKLVTDEFTIVGVLRESAKGDPDPTIGDNWRVRDAEVIVPANEAAAFYFRDPENRKQGLFQLTVLADQEENVKSLAEAITRMDLHQYSLVEVIAQLRVNVLMITFAVVFISFVALVVSAVGITNTMIMSVLERTREIGVMKAVGARDRDVLFIFLIEGALIGLVGGGLGLLLSWGASFPGDAIAKSIMEHQTRTPLNESLFVFSLALTLGVPSLSCLIATLAAVLPARRASRISPVAALRHD